MWVLYWNDLGMLPKQIGAFQNDLRVTSWMPAVWGYILNNFGAFILVAFGPWFCTEFGRGGGDSSLTVHQVYLMLYQGLIFCDM